MQRGDGKILLALALVAGLSACATPVVPPPAVPPPQAEVQPLPPISAQELLWRPGHWEWDGRGYVWIPGEYVPRGNLSGAYQPSYWRQEGGGWVWQPWRWL